MRQTIYEDGQAVVTTFDDGAEVVAGPSSDEENVARAVSLGYGDDLWRMTKEHEIIHRLLAEAEGRDQSIALWYAAHPDYEMDDCDRFLAHREECVVMLIQRLLNEGVEALA